MADEKQILAIDLGTSAVKLALVSARGRITAFERRPLDVRMLPGGGAEQSPEDWWAAIRDGARALIASGVVAPEDVAAVAIGAQWSGTVAVDADGTPLSDALIWMDTRGAEEVERIIRGPIRVGGFGLDKLLAWVPPTGGIPQRSGKDSIAHMLWLKAKRPETYRAAHKLLEPADWIGMRLTGRAAATPATIALYWLADIRDLSHVRYDPALVRRTGVNPAKLPELVPQGTILGPVRPEVARELGLVPGTVAVAGMPDLQAAAIGSGAIEHGEAHLCLGTSSWICCHLPAKRTDVRRGMATLPSGIPGRYLLVNEQENAGICVGWALNLLFPDGSPPEGAAALDALAAGSPPGGGGVLFAPWLNGERTPVDDRLARGSFLNLGLQTSRAHIARAVLEGVALNARWLLRGIERFLRKPFGAIRAIGGGARSDLWCQILADVLERPILRVDEPVRANARGAGLAAAAAMGWLNLRDVPSIVTVDRRFDPDPSLRSTYAAALRELIQVYRATRRIGPRLAAGAKGRRSP